MLRSLSSKVGRTVKPVFTMSLIARQSIATRMVMNRYNSTFSPMSNGSTNKASSEATTTGKTMGTMDMTPLKLSNELYAEFRIHGRPYVVTEGDKVILPYKVNNAEVGDILNLTDVRAIGSRNYKLVDEPIHPSLYTLKATVLEKTKRKFEVREVTKRRNRRVRHAKSKGDLTVIRISELSVK